MNHRTKKTVVPTHYRNPVICQGPKAVGVEAYVLGVRYAEGRRRHSSSVYTSLGGDGMAVGVVLTLGVQDHCRRLTPALGVEALDVALWTDGEGKTASSLRRRLYPRRIETCGSFLNRPSPGVRRRLYPRRRGSIRRRPSPRHRTELRHMAIATPTAMPSA
jgi:hypothetical protein